MNNKNISTPNDIFVQEKIKLLEDFILNFDNEKKVIFELLLNILKNHDLKNIYNNIKSIIIIYSLLELLKGNINKENDIQYLIENLNFSIDDEETSIHPDFEEEIIGKIFGDNKGYKLDETKVISYKRKIKSLIGQVSVKGGEGNSIQNIEEFLEKRLKKEIKDLKEKLKQEKIGSEILKVKKLVKQNIK